MLPSGPAGTKRFSSPARPDPMHPGLWIWNPGDCKPLHYRLPALLAGIAAGEQVFVVEGEKDADDFDADPWQFNTRSGLLDLQNDRMFPHDPSQLLTKVAPVDYDPAALCPGWDAFLARVLGGRADLIRYLQKAVGYSLTGETAEQCLFLLYGQGATARALFCPPLWVCFILMPDNCRWTLCW